MELEKLGAMVIAASVDSIDDAKEFAADFSFPIAWGVTRDDADTLGSWWEARRQIIQPSEFILGEDNKVIVSSYSDGPLGRIDAADAVKLIRFYEKQKAGEK